MLNETRSGSLSAMTCFYSSINGHFVKLLFLIDFIPNFVGIRQGQSPFLEIVDEVRMLYRLGATTREC